MHEEGPVSDEESSRVPVGLRTAAGWAWRLLVILLLGAVVVALMVRLEVLFVALFVALLATALLGPLARWLSAHGVPKVLATALTLLGAIAAIGMLLFFAGRSVASQADELVTALVDGFNQVVVWAEETFGLSLDQMTERLDDVLGSGGESTGGFITSAFGAASTAFEILGGLGITIFATIFFVHDGRGIWSWIVRMFPRSARDHVDRAGGLSWQTLTGYAHGTVLIAAIDALGIGIGAALIGVPLATAIGTLVFFGSFIPIVGALLSGMVAVLIALATQGVTGALLMLAIVIGVQQLEGHLLQPLIQGRFVAIHPLAVVLAVAGGSIMAGIVGAVIAVPIVAVVNVLVRYVAEVHRGETPDEIEAELTAQAEGQTAS